MMIKYMNKNQVEEVKRKFVANYEFKDIISDIDNFQLAMTYEVPVELMPMKTKKEMSQYLGKLLGTKDFKLMYCSNFWTTMAYYYHEYLIENYSIVDNRGINKKTRQDYFVYKATSQVMYRHGVASMWYIQRICGTDSSLLDFIFENYELINILSQCNVCRNFDVFRELLIACQKHNVKLETLQIRKIAEHLDFLSGSFYLDDFKSQDFYEYIFLQLNFKEYKPIGI